LDYLSRIERQLDLPQAEKEEAILELRSHYEDVRIELISQGMDANQADKEAAQRLGNIDEITSRLTAAHARSSWRSAFLASVPFIMWAVWATLLQVLIPTAMHRASILNVVLSFVYGSAMLGGCIREFIRGRRPIWSATWLMAGISSATSISLALCSHIARIPHTNPKSEIIFLLASSVVLGTTAVAACFRRPIMLILAVVCTLPIIALSLKLLDGSTQAANESVVFLGSIMYLYWISTIALLILIAVNVFQRHRYGTPEIASLFLFAAYTLDLPFLASRFQAPGMVAAALTVIVFARAFTWQQKMLIMAAGVLLRTIFLHPKIDTLLIYLFVLAAIYCNIILAPMLFAIKRRRSMKHLAEI
jgi:hypothetical protein